MQQSISRGMVLAGLVAIVSSASLSSRGGDAPKSDRKASSREKVSGVIISVLPSKQPTREGSGTQPSEGSASWKIVVNTDVVWRDFVRDQATDPAKAAKTSTDKAAAKGRESIATEGQPRDSQTLVAVEVGSATPIEMRYRSSTDSIGKGTANPRDAARAEDALDTANDTQDGAKGSRDGRESKAQAARKLAAKELKPGLWIEVDFHPKGDRQKADRVTVMRPVGGPDTAPAREKP